MLFDKKKRVKGIESFNPELCEVEKEKHEVFDKDELAMGCSQGCWSGCIGSCKYNSH